MIQETLNIDGKLSAETIAYLINKTDLDKFTDNNSYFTGNNVTILKKDDPADSTYPNNKVPIPYGRKVAVTTKNYMFSRPIIYTSEDKVYIEMLNSVFNINRNQEKVNRIGEDLIVYGVAYKLFYFAENDGTTPRYALINGDEVIPVYNYDIEPSLIAAIRFYKIVDVTASAKTKTVVEVFYQKELDKYSVDGTTINSTLMGTPETKAHGFFSVPLVVYGDRYQLGVFDTIKKIIDGIDTIISTNLNEIEKFELAYLILKGQSIDPEDVDKIKETRVWELDEQSTLEYLTKQINHEFNGSVLEFLVAQVHKQSGVPDFDSKEFAAESGVALLYKLMGFENLAASYEILFKRGEQDGIDLINSVMYNDSDYTRAKFLKDTVRHVKINMTRNLPEDTLNNIAIAKAMIEMGLSQETAFDFVSVIEDTKAEMEKAVKEKEENFKRFNIMSLAEEDKDDDPDG